MNDFPDFPQLPPVRKGRIAALGCFIALGYVVFYGALITGAAFALKWALSG